MFFDYVKNKYKAGVVSIGLPAIGHGNEVWIVATNNFITKIACLYLSYDEKNQLAELSKYEAIKFKNASKPSVVLDLLSDS